MSERFRIRREPAAEPVEGTAYRCGRAARGLPRILAGALLAAALIAAYQLPPTRLVKASFARQGVMAIGVLAAFWVVRSGRELSTTVVVGDEALEFRESSGRRVLRTERVVAMAFRPPFTANRRWVPALVLDEEEGDRWRIPALIENGDGLIAELLRRTGRNDLSAWVEARRLDDRMGRARQWVVGGYITAGAIVLAALYFFVVHT